MTPRRLRQPVAAAAFAALWIVSIVPVAFAHAELATMTPTDKSTVAAPTEIVATFTETLDPSGSNLVLVDSGGKVVAQGGTVDATDKKKLTLDLSSASLGEGTFTVRWTSKSADDGDLDRGTTTFITIAGPSLPPSAPDTASAAAPPSIEPAVTPSVEASPSLSGGTGSPASSTSDAIIPIVVVLVVLALLGLWLMRSRSRRVG